ncbi:hypothetical protein BurJ1DRAFT_3463 [Burkholderiales bacterium JOSHI_001]|nr:hypothetical protein BurJ1DRAFT_3463 [Burkholderiales bacterium JOSHI_001]
MNSAVAQAALPPEWSAAAWAQRLIEQPEQLPSDFSAEQALAVAWALKDACYAAWSSQPQRAGPAAQALAAMLDQVRASGNWPLDAERELMALGLWTEGIAQIAASHMDEAATALAKAGDLFGALHQDDHAAQTQVPRIMALTLAGRHSDAAECGERTQKEFLRLGDMLSAAKVTLNLGNFQMSRDESRLAATHYRRAAVLFARSGDVQHSVMADIGLGRALTNMGELGEALRINKRARMRADTHSLPVLEAMADESVALLDLARGHYSDALQGFERTRRRYSVLEMPQQLAIAEMQLGEVYLELRLLPESVMQFERSLVAMQELGMRDEQAWVLLSHARAIALLGHAERAQALLRTASTIFATLASHVGQAAVTLAQAELAMALGRPQRAMELADLAAQGFHGQGRVDGEVRAEATAAHALLQLGKSAAARSRLKGALRRAQDMHLVLVQVLCHTGLGLVAQAEGSLGDARTEFETAIRLFDEQRRALPCDEMRSALLANHLRPYQELLRMALEKPEPDADEALRRLDHLSARALGERLLQGAHARGDENTLELRARLNWLYRHVNGRSESGERSPGLIAELRWTEQELLERARRERLLDSPVNNAIQDGHFEPAALCSRLESQDALVEYGVLEDELFACVVQRNGVHLYRRLASWTEVIGAVRAARFQIDAMRYGAEALTPHHERLHRRVTTHLQRLHRLVWEPFAGALANCRRVLVVPYGELGTMPFAALGNGQLTLGEQHGLALCPSAQIALRMLAPWPGAPRKALALGDSQRLVHASQEARAVAAMFPQSQLRVDDQATIEALRTLAADADVVHLACHAEFRRDNPMFSALHLADGPLTAELVEGLRLPNAVVVLSACETGLAGNPSGDELVGLVRAFLVAGASRILATLWPVDDAVTVEFMRHFYQALCAGQTPSSALQQAQKGVRQERPHPFHWAPFVLHGGW